MKSLVIGLRLVGYSIVAPFVHIGIVNLLAKPLNITRCNSGEMQFYRTYIDKNGVRQNKTLMPVTPFQYIVSTTELITGGGWYAIIPPIGLISLPFTILALPCAILDYMLYPIYPEKEKKRDPPSNGHNVHAQLTIF